MKRPSQSPHGTNRSNTLFIQYYLASRLLKWLIQKYSVPKEMVEVSPHHRHGMAIQQQECEVRQRTITTNELSLASETLSEKDDKDGRIKGKLSSLLHAWSTQIHRFMTDWWWWELLSWSISFLSVSAIVALLINYNEKAQPEKLFLGITINAYIAIFAGIGKAALVLPVSEAIGQLKWTWFRAEARLWDFFAIDIASRGPLGSIMLMGRSKCR